MPSLLSLFGVASSWVIVSINSPTELAGVAALEPGGRLGQRSRWGTVLEQQRQLGAPIIKKAVQNHPYLGLRTKQKFYSGGRHPGDEKQFLLSSYWP